MDHRSIAAGGNPILRGWGRPTPLLREQQPERALSWPQSMVLDRARSHPEIERRSSNPAGNLAAGNKLTRRNNGVFSIWP
jgi:hypothetical protein